MFLRNLSLFVGCALAALLGCSNGGGGASTYDEFTTNFCNLYEPCCGAMGHKLDGERCRALLRVVGPPESYLPEEGKTCLEESEAIARAGNFCGNNGVTGSSTPSPAACKRVFGGSSSKAPGTKKPGDTCATTVDCAPSSEGPVVCQTNYFAKGGEIRKCQLQVRGKEGEGPCLGTVEEGDKYPYLRAGAPDDVAPKGYACHREDGLRCPSKPDTCVKLTALGEACTEARSCEKGAYCDSVARKCLARKAAGGACAAGGYAFDTECLDGAYCDDKAKLCTAVRADGAACDAHAECKSGRCVNKVCDKGGSSGSGLALVCTAS